jgi:hypothetical protein
MRYSLLALDLDGTLLSPSGAVSAANAAAVDAARAAGCRVIICTGRGLAEARVGIEGIRQQDPVVVAGGSITSDPTTGATLRRFAMDEGTIAASIDILHASGHAALVLKDRASVGYDYLVVHGKANHALDPVTQWWFASMGVQIRRVAHLHEDEHPDHTVRLGACAPSHTLHTMEAALRKALGTSANIHNFPAVVAPKEARGVAGSTMHVLEVFSSQATKWNAIAAIARDWQIPHHRIMAVGDEINDLDMITHAGLGVAMGNAVPTIKNAAKQHTLTHSEDGVAAAIRKALAGEW